MGRFFKLYFTLCLIQTEFMVSMLEPLAFLSLEIKGLEFNGVRPEVIVRSNDVQSNDEQSNDEESTEIIEDGPEASLQASTFESPSIDGAISTNETICQIRIDFDDFDLPDRVHGKCPGAFFITHGAGYTESSFPNPLCGYMTGQHVYITVSGNKDIHYNVQSWLPESNVTYKIRFTKIPCDHPEMAPANCLQYYDTDKGSIKSLNYRKGGSGYFNNSNYDICIKQQDGYCNIVYSNPDRNEFNIESHVASQYLLTGVDCFYDCLILGGKKYCGQWFAMLVKDDEPKRGLFRITMKSDSSIQGTGFSLKFQQFLCAEDF